MSRLVGKWLPRSERGRHRLTLVDKVPNCAKPIADVRSRCNALRIPSNKRLSQQVSALDRETVRVVSAWSPNNCAIKKFGCKINGLNFLSSFL